MLTNLSGKVSSSHESVSIRIHDQSESASVPSSWKPTLKGLDQFSEFLLHFVNPEDIESMNAFQNHGPSFFLRYYQNLYIFALVEASQKGVKILDDIVNQIHLSFSNSGLCTSDELGQSLKVKLIVFLNGSFFRPLVKHLWKGFVIIKARFL